MNLHVRAHEAQSKEERKCKKRDKKLSNCRVGLAIWPPHIKRDYKPNPDNLLGGLIVPEGLLARSDLRGWVGSILGRFVSLVAVIRVTINLVMN